MIDPGNRQLAYYEARAEAVASTLDCQHLGVGEGFDARVVGHRGHARRGDAACTVQRREHLAQVDHATADAGAFFR